MDVVLHNEVDYVQAGLGRVQRWLIRPILAKYCSIEESVVIWVMPYLAFLAECFNCAVWIQTSLRSCGRVSCSDIRWKSSVSLLSNSGPSYMLISTGIVGRIQLVGNHITYWRIHKSTPCPCDLLVLHFAQILLACMVCVWHFICCGIVIHARPVQFVVLFWKAWEYGKYFFNQTSLGV